MAQRRISGIKRRSRGGRSGNNSGFLNDDTNFIQLNKDDNQWFNLTSVRPSTSINLSQRASEELNPDSNVNESQLSENWHENLPQSDSFRLLKQAAEKNQSDTDGSGDINVDDITESESEKEFRTRIKKRAGIRAKLSKQHNDSTNVFLKALEKTTDTTKNLTSVASHDSESSATTTPSKTRKKNKSASEYNASNDMEDGTTHVIPKRRRAEIRSRLNKNQNDSTNVFFKVLEDSTDLTKNITSVGHDSEVQISESQRANVTTRSGSRLTVSLNRIQEHSISNSLSKTQKQNKSTNESTLNKTQNQVSTRSKTNESQNEVSTKNKSIAHESQNEPSPRIKSVANKSQNEVSSKKKSISNESQNEISTRNKSVANKSQNEISTRNKSVANKSQNEISTRNKSVSNKSQNEVSSRRTSIANESENQISLRHESSFDETQDQEDSRNDNTINETQDQEDSRNENTITESQDQEDSRHENTIAESQSNVEAESEINNSSRLQQSNKSRSIKDKTNNLSNNVSINSPDKNLDSAIQKTPVSTRTRSRLSDSPQTQNQNNSTKNTPNKSKNQTKISSFMTKNQSATKSRTVTGNTNDFNNVSSRNVTNSRMNSERSLSQAENRLSAADKSRKRKKSVAENITEETNDEQEDIRSKTFVNKSAKKAKSTDHQSENSTNKQVDLENERTNVSRSESRVTNSPNKTQKKKSVTDKSKTNTTYKVVSESPKNQSINKSLSNANVTKSKSHVTSESVSNSRAKETFERPKQNLFSKGKENRAVDNMFDGGLESDGAISSYSKASDDILHTPHPLQSTLAPSGKPLSRLTIFNSRQSLFDRLQDTPPASTHSSRNEHQSRTSPGQEPPTEDNEPQPAENVPPLLSRRVTDIPEETERSTNLDESQISARSLMNRSNRSNRSRHSENATKIPDSTWLEVQKNLDAMAKKLEDEERRKKELEREEELRKKKNQSELWRKILQRKKEAIRNAKPKKPVHKAYLVNGKVYKQPRLPKPQKWVTDKLYNHLWRCMEPKYHIRTRIKSEKFVQRLSDLSKVILRRKKYDNYEAELNEILVMMARYRIIETRYDFYRFCSDYMPYKFRFKVVPMMLPGNVRNIPYDQKLTYVPILENGSGSDSSDNEAGDKTESGDDESSESESE